MQAVKLIKPLMRKALFIFRRSAGKVFMVLEKVLTAPSVSLKLSDESDTRSKNWDVSNVLYRGGAGWSYFNFLRTQ